MIRRAETCTDLIGQFEPVGLLDKISGSTKSVAIKVNLPRPPKVNRPRTDFNLLKSVMMALRDYGHKVTIIECANGLLEDNLRSIGFGSYISERICDFKDLDRQMASKYYTEDGSAHYLPNCLSEFDVRIAIPCTHYGDKLIFSNNIKTFIGLLPIPYYSEDIAVNWRPRLHTNIHLSIADVFWIVDRYFKFDFFINGGNCYIYSTNVSRLPGYFLSDDPIELDKHIATLLGLKIPEYLQIIDQRYHQDTGSCL